MEKTRGSLTEKLEALEGQVSETVASTAGAVQDTTQTVQETVTVAVDAVKDTVATVTDKVEETMAAVTDKFQETVQSVTETFSLRVQMERHPFFVIGGAVAAGIWLGTSFGPSRETPSTIPSAFEPPPAPPPWSKPASRSNGASYSESESEPDAGGLWTSAISHVKDIGISYLMALVRDLAKRELPDVLGKRIADEVDALTTKMGAEPISGSLLPEREGDQSQNESDSGSRAETREKKSTTYRGRSPAEANAI